jgi:hypothetical protein
MLQFSPYPIGKLFAITFVDDTDFSTRENTECVYDFLAQHRFWGTKTVWPLRAKRTSAFRASQERSTPEDGTGATLEDPDYAAFIRGLQARGFEIGLHGVAAGNSRRSEIEAGLAHFRAVLGQSPSVNAFHRANLENLYGGIHKLDSPVLRLLERVVDGSRYEGHVEGAASFWGDIAYDTFRYVRLPFHTIDEINTLRVNPSMPFWDPRRPYVHRWFAASDGADVVRFNRLLSETSVCRLARQGGTCIMYTHFAKGFARPGPSGYTLNADFVRTVKRVTSHSAAWFATASQVLDRLAAARMVSLSHEGRRLEVQNCSGRAIDGMVMRVPDGMEVCCANGRTLASGSGTVVLPRLEPERTVILMTNGAGAQTIQARSSEISSREHRRIEYWNYVGLIRGWVKDRAHYALHRRRATSQSW